MVCDPLIMKFCKYFIRVYRYKNKTHKKQYEKKPQVKKQSAATNILESMNKKK